MKVLIERLGIKYEKGQVSVTLTPNCTFKRSISFEILQDKILRVFPFNF